MHVSPARLPSCSSFRSSDSGSNRHKSSWGEGKPTSPELRRPLGSGVGGEGGYEPTPGIHSEHRRQPPEFLLMGGWDGCRRGALLRFEGDFSVGSSAQVLLPPRPCGCWLVLPFAGGQEPVPHGKSGFPKLVSMNATMKSDRRGEATARRKAPAGYVEGEVAGEPPMGPKPERVRADVRLLERGRVRSSPALNVSELLKTSGPKLRNRGGGGASGLTTAWDL